MYAVDTLIGSIMMYIAVAIYSPMLAAVQFFGAFTASMTGNLTKLFKCAKFLFKKNEGVSLK